jgi:hypothetical protein
MVTYVSGNDVSDRVWQHIQTQQYDLIDSQDAAFGAAQWYSRGDGRAGFFYNLDCAQARERVEAVLEEFARSAPMEDVAEALRASKATVREITQAQFEDAEPL